MVTALSLSAEVAVMGMYQTEKDASLVNVLVRLNIDIQNMIKHQVSPLM